MISASLQSLKTRPFLKWIKRHWREGRTRYLQNNVNKIPQKIKVWSWKVSRPRLEVQNNLIQSCMSLSLRSWGYLLSIHEHPGCELQFLSLTVMYFYSDIMSHVKFICCDLSDWRLSFQVYNHHCVHLLIWCLFSVVLQVNLCSQQLKEINLAFILSFALVVVVT